MSKNPFDKAKSPRAHSAPSAMNITPGVMVEASPYEPASAVGAMTTVMGAVVPSPSNGAGVALQHAAEGSYLSALDPDSVLFRLALFDGNRNTTPKHEYDGLTWAETAALVAPRTPPVVPDKAHAQYVGAYTLRIAPLIGKTRKHAEKSGLPLEGKQRSKAHVDKCGPLIMLDKDEGNVLDCEVMVRALGSRGVIYTSHSYGKTLPQGSVKLSGRIVLAGDRTWAPDDHPYVMAAANHLIGGGADTQAMGVSQIMGSGVKRSPDAPYEWRVFDGGVLSIDKLVTLGRELAPVRTREREHPGKTAEEASRRYDAYQVELALKLIPNDEGTDYTMWMLTSGGVHSALGQAGYPLYEQWSAQNVKHDPAATEKKYFTDAPGIDFDAERLMWIGRRCAEDIMHTLYPAQPAPGFEHLRGATLPSAFTNALEDDDELAAGLERYRAPRTLDKAEIRNRFGTEEAAGIAVVAFMKSTWTDMIYRQFLASCAIPTSTVQKGEAHAATLRERSVVAHRAVIEQGGGIGGGIEQVRDAILSKVLAGEMALYQQGQTALCRLTHGPCGQVKASPVNSSATLRTLIAEWTVLKVSLKNGGYGYEDIRFTGKGASAEFDLGMLKDLYERVLPEALPELVAVSSVPIMPSLPATGSLEHLLRSGADEIVSAAGYHHPSKLFIATEGATLTRKLKP